MCALWEDQSDFDTFLLRILEHALLTTPHICDHKINNISNLMHFLEN